MSIMNKKNNNKIKNIIVPYNRLPKINNENSLFRDLSSIKKNTTLFVPKSLFKSKDENNSDVQKLINHIQDSLEINYNGFVVIDSIEETQKLIKITIKEKLDLTPSRVSINENNNLHQNGLNNDAN